MRIDRTHRSWLIAFLVLLVCLTLTYLFQAARTPGGARGSTPAGLTYGVLGFALMIYASLLGLRKKVPVWRIGRAQTWMRGHLWLGMLSLPVVLFHCGFQVHGQLTSLLMVLLTITIVSGIAGAALQHFVPTQLTTSVPMETIYEEIPNVRRQLCKEADQLVETMTGAGLPGESTIALSMAGQKDVTRIYVQSIRPFLMDRPTTLRPQTQYVAFDRIRQVLPEKKHTLVRMLEDICEEERQLQRQRRMHLWLHSWLLLHIPVSIALLLLTGIHAVIALRY